MDDRAQDAGARAKLGSLHGAVATNEVYKISLINLETVDTGDDNLTYTLGVNRAFTMEVMPAKGAVLRIDRTTPIFLDIINFLN